MFDTYISNASVNASEFLLSQICWKSNFFGENYEWLRGHIGGDHGDFPVFPVADTGAEGNVTTYRQDAPSNALSYSKLLPVSKL